MRDKTERRKQLKKKAKDATAKKLKETVDKLEKKGPGEKEKNNEEISGQ